MANFDLIQSVCLDIFTELEALPSFEDEFRFDTYSNKALILYPRVCDPFQRHLFLDKHLPNQWSKLSGARGTRLPDSNSAVCSQHLTTGRPFLLQTASHTYDNKHCSDGRRLITR